MNYEEVFFFFLKIIFIFLRCHLISYETKNYLLGEFFTTDVIQKLLSERIRMFLSHVSQKMDAKGQ